MHEHRGLIIYGISIATISEGLMDFVCPVQLMGKQLCGLRCFPGLDYFWRLIRLKVNW